MILLDKLKSLENFIFNNEQKFLNKFNSIKSVSLERVSFCSEFVEYLVVTENYNFIRDSCSIQEFFIWVDEVKKLDPLFGKVKVEIPKNHQLCVHTEHCCILHGCCYGGPCPVEDGFKIQSYLCESCDPDWGNCEDENNDIWIQVSDKIKERGHIS